MSESAQLEKNGLSFHMAVMMMTTHLQRKTVDVSPMGLILRGVQAPRVATTQILSLGHRGRSINAEKTLRAPLSSGRHFRLTGKKSTQKGLLEKCPLSLYEELNARTAVALVQHWCLSG